MERYMPRKRADFEARDGTMVLVIEKTPDVYRLRDLISALGGSIEPKHVAWMMNTVLNIACYLERAGLTHNAITPDSYFVSPKYHSGLLLGDWWFAAKAGQSRCCICQRPRTRWLPPISSSRRPRTVGSI
jgi:hypothetical protein